MLVDAEPYGTVTSQLFFDTMQFGINGGCRVTCPRTWRVMSRYVNFQRNSYNGIKAGIASVIWQTSIPKTAGLQLDPHDSPALRALAEALEDGGVLGLTVRWNTYRTIYFDDPTILSNKSPELAKDSQALIAKLNVANSFQPNPARSLLVGVVGLWREGEPACEPGDRALLAQGAETVATAFARINDDTLVLDLGNSVAEVDAELNKQDLGPLSVCAMSPDGTSIVKVLAALPYPRYGRDCYVATSGLITIPLSAGTAELVATAPLQVRSGDTVYLSEQTLRAAPTTQQNIYLDENGADVAADLQVLEFGAPAGAGVTVSRYNWDSVSNVATLIDTAQSNEAGIATFQVAPAAEGTVLSYIFTVGADALAPTTLDTLTTPYIYARTLPADAAIGALDPSWVNVYSSVLSKWNAMAPCMDNWLLLNEPAQVHAYGAVLKKLTDPANFEAFRFMPVTRDMTQGERTLLYKFLDAPLGEGARALKAGPATDRARPALPKVTQLSRAMRR
jgi:predicted secreted protein